jgi:hypothetical protein
VPYLATTHRSPSDDRETVGRELQGGGDDAPRAGAPPPRLDYDARDPDRIGDIVARAKRTDRAEARRRHRAQLASEAIDSPSESDDVEPESPSSARRRNEAPPGRRPVSSRDQPAERLGFMAALRGAYEPAHIREDLAALPNLVRSRAIIVPALLVVASVIVLIVAINTENLDATGASRIPSPSVAGSAASADVRSAASTSPGASPSGPSVSGPSPSGPSASGTAGGGAGGSAPVVIVASLLNLLFLQTPPIGGIYAAAVLAKRSSYLAGGIAGLLGALGLTVVLYSVPVDAAIGDVRAAYAGQAIVTSTVFGVLLGGALGYYRRLLRLMNPNRARPAPAGRGATARRRR